MDLPARFADGADMLHQQAIQATGLEDFGDTAYLEGLQVLLAG